MTEPAHLTRSERLAEERARDLRAFLAGFEDAHGHPELLRRSRMAARDVLDVLRSLEAERSARVALQAQRDNLLEIVSKATYDHVRDSA